jgi:hypothetical protein
MTNFKNKTMNEIRLWAWAAAVLPLSSLAAMFFIWVYGLDHWINIVMIIGSTTMFTVAVAWWWWAMYVFKRLLELWVNTGEGLSEVLTDVKEIRQLVEEVIPSKKDK